MNYLINLPHDYDSDAGYNEMIAYYVPESLDMQNPEVEADVIRDIWDHLLECWPDLILLQERDYGGVFSSETPPPADLPQWFWVTCLEDSQ